MIAMLVLLWVAAVGILALRALAQRRDRRDAAVIDALIKPPVVKWATADELTQIHAALRRARRQLSTLLILECALEHRGRDLRALRVSGQTGGRAC